MSGTGHLGTFRNDHDGKRPITGASRYYFHDVKMPDGTVFNVKTNLSMDDLEYLFPQDIHRTAWLRYVARLTSLPSKVK